MYVAEPLGLTEYVYPSMSAVTVRPVMGPVTYCLVLSGFSVKRLPDSSEKSCLSLFGPETYCLALLGRT